MRPSWRATDSDQLAFGAGSELYWLPAGGLMESDLGMDGLSDLVGVATHRTKGTVEQVTKKFVAGQPPHPFVQTFTSAWSKRAIFPSFMSATCSNGASRSAPLVCWPLRRPLTTTLSPSSLNSSA